MPEVDRQGEELEFAAERVNLDDRATQHGRLGVSTLGFDMRTRVLDVGDPEIRAMKFVIVLSLFCNPPVAMLRP